MTDTHEFTIPEIIRSLVSGRESISEVLLLQLSGLDDVGARLWIHQLRRAITQQLGFKLRKRGEVFEVSSVEHQLRQAVRHGVKSIKQKEYQVETLRGGTIRDDVSELDCLRISGKLEKAEMQHVDMRGKQRQRQRMADLLNY